MKLIFIRHGEPDYTIDSLTPKGWRESEILSDRLSKMDIKNFYLSPLGRAKDTAKPTLEKMNRTGEVLDWLQEFDVPVIREGETTPYIVPWDQLPQHWTKVEKNYHPTDWVNAPVMLTGDVAAKTLWVQNGIDNLLKKYGYVREGNYYRAENPNNDTIAFFCHFGVTCVILGHILGISPVVMWHGFCAAPSSVTTVVTEERRQGIAYFRMGAYGDTSHLYAAGEPISFSARFCECYDNMDERHD